MYSRARDVQQGQGCTAGLAQTFNYPLALARNLTLTLALVLTLVLTLTLNVALTPTLRREWDMGCGENGAGHKINTNVSERQCYVCLER